MGFVSVDVFFLDSPEVCGLSDKAFRVHFDTLLYAERFDLWVLPPHITDWMRKRNKGRRRHVDELVMSGLWLPCAEGHRIARLHRPKQQGRPHIPLDIRRAVHERDGGECVICAATDRLTLDHIHPFSAGGADTIDNLRLMCQPCNSRRGAGRYSDEELRDGI